MSKDKFIDAESGPIIPVIVEGEPAPEPVPEPVPVPEPEPEPWHPLGHRLPGAYSEG